MKGPGVRIRYKITGNVITNGIISEIKKCSCSSFSQVILGLISMSIVGKLQSYWCRLPTRRAYMYLAFEGTEAVLFDVVLTLFESVAYFSNTLFCEIISKALD